MSGLLLKPVATMIFGIVSARVSCDNRYLAGVRSRPLTGDAQNWLGAFRADQPCDLFDVGSWQLAGIRHEMLMREIPAIAVRGARAQQDYRDHGDTPRQPNKTNRNLLRNFVNRLYQLVNPGKIHKS